MRLPSLEATQVVKVALIVRGDSRTEHHLRSQTVVLA